MAKERERERENMIVLYIRNVTYRSIANIELIDTIKWVYLFSILHEREIVSSFLPMFEVVTQR